MSTAALIASMMAIQHDSRVGYIAPVKMILSTGCQPKKNNGFKRNLRSKIKANRSKK